MLRTAVLGAALALVAMGGAMAADTELADPAPGWDNPRRIMLQLTSDDPGRVNGILHNAVNLQKFYGQDNVQVAIIAYGAGVRAVLAASSPVKERVASLLQYDVEFVACGNTMTAIGKSESDLLPGVRVATAGIAEIVERKLKGWHYIVP
ncbi:MAG: DsrE family protein [Rhodospirillales bacterium]|nr:DsrE family protein [Rhodospirillales bacterium]